MKKTLIAALASLMLAGALCAVDGATAVSSGAAFVIIGDGGGPIIASPPAEAANSDAFALPDQF